MFAVCWGGVYLGTRTFLPMLLASEAGHVVNTSSVNGFWATLGGSAHTAYSAAKFAVKGFTEALITDFRVNAPHLRASVVMPGHIGTSIVFNSGAYFGRDPKELTDAQVAELRERLAAQGLDVTTASDEDVRNGDRWRWPRASATTPRRRRPRRRRSSSTASAPASGGSSSVDDAHLLDEAVRATPTEAYEPEFMERLRAEGVFTAIPTGLTPSGAQVMAGTLSAGTRGATETPRRAGEDHADADEQHHQPGADAVGDRPAGVLVERPGRPAR